LNLRIRQKSPFGLVFHSARPFPFLGVVARFWEKFR
jgi:hypothetical protein